MSLEDNRKNQSLLCLCIVYKFTMPLLQDKYTIAILSNIITLDFFTIFRPITSSHVIMSYDLLLLNKTKTNHNITLLQT